jgi:Cu(I)/Ag(I) efflux system periplasmic protein CusF
MRQKNIAQSVSIALAGLLSMAAFAQAPAKPAEAATVATAAAAPMTNAEVRKVDKDTKKITLKHEEIKNLDMPPMTMVFQVKDATLLDKVKAGDKVRFSAEKAASGYTVTGIEVAK